jgi:hypothetical protein
MTMNLNFFSDGTLPKGRFVKTFPSQMGLLLYSPSYVFLETELRIRSIFSGVFFCGQVLLPS